MPPNPVNDVTPPRRSIRSLVLPHSAGDQSEPAAGRGSGAADNGSIGGRGRGTRYGKRLWAVAIFSIALLYVVFSVFFAGAQVIIETREYTGSVDGTFAASAEGMTAPLTYRLVSIEKEATRGLPATGEEFVERKSSGTIVIYNNYDEKPQRLIKNTRFETPDGLIYRIAKSLDVPGRRKADNSLANRFDMGSIEAVVFADAVGERYNIPQGTRFTIPGLKGDPRFGGFYAETKTPIEGGFAGVVKTVSSAAEDEARRSLKAELESALKAEITGSIPERALWYEDGAIIRSLSLANRWEGDKVIVGEKAGIHAMVFDQVAFSKHLARATVAGFDEGDVVIENFDELAVTFLEKEAFDPAVKGEVRFSVRGTPHFRWVFDEARLRADLAGKSKRAINTILAGYPAIAKAEVILRPFWDSTFPKKPESIVLILKGQNSEGAPAQ
ncbi:MAG: hypothetical protein Q8R39_01410 [bacterium]|nr:hypothetical protein [bacterium]MDZ4284696.1 hypothetical protein [Patescibacteria group bacterium]